MKIRKIKETDLNHMVSLINYSGEVHTSLEDITDKYKKINPDPSYMTFIAEENTEFLGFIQMKINFSYLIHNKSCSILSLIIKKDLSQIEIGNFLIEAAEKWATDQGAKTIFSSELYQGLNNCIYKKLEYNYSSVDYTKSLHKIN